MILLIYRRYSMTEPPKKNYINTTVKNDLLISLKVLAAQKGMRMNQLLEEAIQDLLKKYENKSKE
jgi:hypothetical protein